MGTLALILCIYAALGIVGLLFFEWPIISGVKEPPKSFNEKQRSTLKEIQDFISSAGYGPVFVATFIIFAALGPVFYLKRAVKFLIRKALRL